MRHLISFAIILFASLLATTKLFAQQVAEPNLKWGHPTQQELEMTSYDADPDADAVVLCKTTDVQYIITKDVLQVLYNVKGRIKILKPEGTKHAFVDIYYTVNDGVEGNREVVSNFKGTTFNLTNGQLEKSELTSDMVNTFKPSDPKQRVMTLLFPDARTGSVIEYEYTITSDLYREIKDWEAQCDMPVAYTKYEVSIPEWFGFYVQTIGNEYNSSRISQQRTDKRPTYVIETSGAEYECSGVNFEFEGRKLSPLKSEPLIFSPQVYAQRVIIDIETELLPRHTKHKYSMTWDEIDQHLLKHNNFGKLLTSNPLKKEMKKAGISNLKSDDEKILATVKLLRQHVKWNGKYELFGNTPSQVLKNGTGSNADINFMLIAMLNDAGLNAYPAILSTRDCDILDDNHPTMKNISSVIAVIDRGDKFQVFDGSVENANIDILPTNFLVSKARVIKKDNIKPWINLEDKGIEQTNHKITGDIDQNGKLTATCVSTYNDKAAEQMRKAIKNRGEKCPNKKLQSSQITVTNYNTQGVDDIEKPVAEIIDFTCLLNCKDGVITLPQLIVPFIDEKLFKSDTRYNPIEFPTKVDETIDIALTIPDGWEVADMPAPISLNTSDNTIVMSITPSIKGNTVNVSTKLSIKRLVFNKRDYKGIKNLVDRITKQSKEPFVIKKK
ncbi:MAG: DUF3857 domain-containing protein [Muribaculaceae bacterium]|nr:DUF3857 domain-containing protein [Muribaculaceae bacterium]